MYKLHIYYINKYQQTVGFSIEIKDSSNTFEDFGAKNNANMLLFLVQAAFIWFKATTTSDIEGRKLDS